MNGFIFDIKAGQKGEGELQVLIKNKKDLMVRDRYDHYLYLIPDDKIDKTKKKLEKDERIKKIEIEKKKIWEDEEIEALKVYPKDPKARSQLRKDLKEFGETREEDIPFIYRYLIDKNLYPMTYYDFEIKNDKLTSFKKIDDDKVPKLKMCSFDIEVYNKDGIPQPEKDPILVIGYKDDKEDKIFFWRKGKGSEKKIIKDFLDMVKKKNVDVISGYNSAGFDFPYLKKRADLLKIDLDLGVDGSPIRTMKRGVTSIADMFGRIHLDTYRSVEFLTRIGTMRLPRNNLESVYKEFFGKEKLDIDSVKIWEYWEKGGKDLKLLVEYNKEDTIATFEIAKEILPLYMELSRIVGLPGYEVSRMGTSQIVEWLLVRKAHKQNIIVPKRPSSEVFRRRIRQPFVGAFVKMPESGLHENIVICDFKSLYPSIMVVHNVDPFTLNCKCCKKPHVSPQGHKFCKKHQGLIPKIVEDILNARVKVKKEMKKYKRKSPEYIEKYFRQWALKIIANSTYGYLGYARAKWYSREAAESVTAWGRGFIHDTIDRAEKEGFKVLYADTDGVFLKLVKGKTVKDAEEFVEKVNKDLPEKMELEFEGYYPRGIFVMKREGEKAAKKRYALIREDGTIEIKGFEFVRRDWSNIARRTQERVIETVLKEGKPKKAVNIVKKVIEDVRKGNVDLDDLVILTQITRRIEAYEQKAPHVKAAQKLKDAGYKVQPGTMIEYIVISGRGSISDRSIPIQLLGKKKYDPDYYIEHQILPAVMKILFELGVKREDLKFGGKQVGLKKWT